MGFNKCFKLLQNLFSKPNNNSEDSGELQACPPGQRFFGGDCNRCLGNGKNIYFRPGNKWIEEKNCKYQDCSTSASFALRYPMLETLYCGKNSRVPYKECTCITKTIPIG
jgi:hypothetical protein